MNAANSAAINRPFVHRVYSRGEVQTMGFTALRFLIGAFLLLPLFALVSRATLAQTVVAPPAAQNPSPMADDTRAHERLSQKILAGTARTFVGPAAKTVEVFVPTAYASRPRDGGFDLLLHFHGAAWLPEQAASAADARAVIAVLNLGAGSGIYDRSFSDALAFDSLLAAITREVAATTGKPAKIARITLVGFSAGHGAIRAILREPRHFARVRAVMLLDGMHTSYVPEGTGLASGGTIDSTNLVALTNFARAAVRGDKQFLVTHSEIFPGTYASTTETADWMVRALGLKRKAVLKWGPRGMQQLSEVRSGKFHLLGFAGNSAPDHIDQLHAMPEFLQRLWKQ